MKWWNYMYIWYWAQEIDYWYQLTRSEHLALPAIYEQFSYKSLMTTNMCWQLLIWYHYKGTYLWMIQLWGTERGAVSPPKRGHRVVPKTSKWSQADLFADHSHILNKGYWGRASETRCEDCGVSKARASKQSICKYIKKNIILEWIQLEICRIRTNYCRFYRNHIKKLG